MSGMAPPWISTAFTSLSPKILSSSVARQGITFRQYTDSVRVFQNHVYQVQLYPIHFPCGIFFSGATADPACERPRPTSAFRTS